MSDPTQADSSEAPSDDSIDRDDGVQRLVRTALDDRDSPRVDVLAGFQRRMRERSGGKFYADRWATSRQPPIATYLVTSAVMLAIILALYLVLAPLRGAAKSVDGVPEPIQVVAPAPAVPPSG